MRLALMMGVGCAAVMLAASVASAENGRISNQVLNDMGLSGMTIMSDQAAAEVRGMGYRGGKSKSYAYASGESWANVGSNPDVIGLLLDGGDGGAGTTNKYRAKGPHHADGYNFSAAGYLIIGGGHHGGGGMPGPWVNDQVQTTTNNPPNNGGGGNHGGGLSLKIYFAGGFSGANAW